jgi:hypothetical protein
MSKCPEQFKLDVNERYQKGVGLVTSLATASLVLPILFLKDIVNVTKTQTVAEALTPDVYLGWKLLAVSIGLGVIYYYFSAKWVKLAWDEKTDICWIPVNANFVEKLLDYSYLIMMACFGWGMYEILSFIVEYAPQG